MPEIALKKNTIYLNKYIRTETDRTTFLIYQKKLVLASKDKERAATGGGLDDMLPQKRHFYNVPSLRSRRFEVVGAGVSACLPRARPFFLAPATFKRLLRRLRTLEMAFLGEHAALPRP